MSSRNVDPHLILKVNFNLGETIVLKNFNQLIVLTSGDQDFSYMHDREKLTSKTNHVGKHGTEIGKLLEA
jgi:hypothetical protein